MCSIAEEKAGRGRKSAVIPRAAVPPCPRSAGEGIDLVDDGGGFAVIFAGGHDAHGAVTGLVDDDGDHEGGGEAEGEGVSLIEGHVNGSCLGGGRTSSDRQAPDVSGRRPQSPRKRTWTGNGRAPGRDKVRKN